MNAVATIQAPRLPYHPAIAERFGVDQGAWRVLTDAVFPAAERPESIIMALAYCKARNLDIFKKPVQIVPIYDKKRGGMVDTVWPGIAELRTTAMRTGSFAGFRDTEFGPMISEKLSGVDTTYPEWAQCTVYRLIGGQRVEFVGPKTFWLETYATAKRDTKAPNSMWAKRPRGQLEKCAEAAALRRAFPEEIGNEYAAEEMEGKAMLDGVAIIDRRGDPTGPRQLHAGFETVAELAHDPDTGEIIDAEVIDPPADDGLPVRDDTADEDRDHDEVDGEGKPAGVGSFGGLGLKTGAQVAAEQASDAEVLDWAASFNRGVVRMESVTDISDAWNTAKSSGQLAALKKINPGMAGALANAVNERVAELNGTAD